MELRALVELMINDNVFMTIANDPLSQFGTPTRSYLGAQLLPENTDIPGNTYKEEFIEFRSIIANAGTRYSPPQIKGNTLVASMFVDLAESDTGAEFTASDYDALIRMLERLPNYTELSQVPPEAMTSLIKWADTGLNVPLVEINEYWRWQAIVDAVVQLRGDNGFSEDVNYYAPPGQRVNAGGDWTDPTYDPYPELATGPRVLLAKGYHVSRQITSTNVIQTLLSNPNILRRLGILSIAGGSVVGLAGMASLDQLNAKLAQDTIPPLEPYDLQYRKTFGTDYFLKRDVLVQVATTGRDRTIDAGDKEPFTLPNTLGYVGVGRPANRSVNGRAFKVRYNDGKGAAVMGEAWQTSLPVIENPEGIYVIKNINTNFTQFP